jgi:hypothetical protein
MNKNIQRILKDSKLFSKKKYKCEYCRDIGYTFELLNYSYFYEPFEESIYIKVPCEECGGY